MKGALISFGLAVVLLFASSARAQSPAADELYAEAGELMKAKRFAEACPKLETSQRLDPGIGTLLRLGYCYEQIGRMASAWSAYNDATALAARAGDKRAEEAAARAKALQPRLSKLLITVAEPQRGLEVRRDGTLLDHGLLGTPTPIDPGDHTIDASAPGKLPWRGSARIESTPGITTISIPPLAPAAEPQEATPSSSGRRVGGVVLGSVGVAGLLAGAALGAVALEKNSASKQNCSPMDPNFCNVTGASVRSQAVAFGNGSTGAIAAGGALLVGGILLFVTAPSAKKVNTAAIELVPGIGALTFRGRF